MIVKSQILYNSKIMHNAKLLRDSLPYIFLHKNNRIKIEGKKTL